IVPYTGTVRVYNLTGPAITFYTRPRSSVGIDAVDPVLLGGACSVPNVNTADFFDIATGAPIGGGTVALPFPSVREVDMVPVPEVGRVFWPLDGGICRFDPATGTLDATLPIP